MKNGLDDNRLDILLLEQLQLKKFKDILYPIVVWSWNVVPGYSKIATTSVPKNTKKEYLNGYTDNYIKIEIPYKKEFENKILNIKMESINKNGNIKGTII